MRKTYLNSLITIPRRKPSEHEQYVQAINRINYIIIFKEDNNNDHFYHRHICIKINDEKIQGFHNKLHQNTTPLRKLEENDQKRRPREGSN